MAIERFGRRACRDDSFIAKVEILIFVTTISRKIRRRHRVIESLPVPIVSVIMSIRDSAATVNSAVGSLIRQTFSDWELILIDDGSRDDGAARAARFNDPRIRIIRHEEHRGLAYRLNEAVDLARGEFIARMDADDICYPERLDTQLRLLQSNSRIDVVASKALVFRRQGEIIGVMSPPPTHDEIIACPYRGFMFPHPTWCGKAAWFRKHQYDERMWLAQDQELLLRAAASSRFAAIDKILLGYRKEHISLSKSIQGRMLFSRAVWQHARRSKDQARAAAQIMVNLGKFAAETAAIGLGAEEWLLKQKFVSLLTREETTRWRAVWNDMQYK
jgi:glycosyltransferase involved in cell wall biosynthesis